MHNRTRMLFQQFTCGASILVMAPALIWCMDQHNQNSAIEYKRCSNNYQTTITAYDNGLAVGWAIYYKNELLRLQVNPSHQKRTIGTKLFIACLQDIASHKYEHAHWHAHQSIPFYQRFGAKITQMLSEKPLHSSALMEFVFSRDGDPQINYQQHRLTKKE